MVHPILLVLYSFLTATFVVGLFVTGDPANILCALAVVGLAALDLSSN